MRNLDEILELVDTDLKMDLMQQELDRYTEKQNNSKNHQQSLENSVKEVENRTLSHIQRLIEEYYKDKQPKLMFLYETKENKKIFYNVIQDETKNEEELKQIIENENGKITKKFEVVNNIISVDDKPIRKIKNLGKTFRLIEIKN